MSETYRIEVLSKEREVLMAVCENHVEGGIWARVYNLDSAFEKIVEAKPVTPVDAQPTGLTEEDWDCIVDSLECDWGNENGTIPKPIHDLIEKIDKLRTQAGVVLSREMTGWTLEHAELMGWLLRRFPAGAIRDCSDAKLAHEVDQWIERLKADAQLKAGER